MAFSSDLKTYALKASSDLSGNQYHIVYQDAALSCDVASNATESAICGVLQNKPQSGEHATVADGGISKVVAGAAVTQGDHLTVNGSGRAVTVGSGDMAVGRALEAAGADGDIISARLYPPVRWSGAA